MSNPNIKTVIFNGETVRAVSMPGYKRYLILENGIILYSETEKICPDYGNGRAARNSGYRKIKIFNDDKERKCFYVHRLIWLAYYGKIPRGYEVDHINFIRNDNRLVNLRIIPVLHNRTRHKVLENGI